MTKEIKDENWQPLQEGFYLKLQHVIGRLSEETIVYVFKKGDEFYEDRLLIGADNLSHIWPVEVSDEVRFRPFTQKSVEWLRQKLSQLEQKAQGGK